MTLIAPYETSEEQSDSRAVATCFRIFQDASIGFKAILATFRCKIAFSKRLIQAQEAMSQLGFGELPPAPSDRG